MRYFDGLTNDARLVLDTLRSAAKAGATVLNYATFRNAERSSHWECEIEDRISGSVRKIQARAVVNAVISLAHALSLRVVAEGVETPGQRDILLGMHCDELQGFLYARPMSADALLAWSQGDKPTDGADFTPSTIGTL